MADETIKYAVEVDSTSATKGLERTEKAAKEAERALKGVGDKAGGAESILMGLAGVLDLIHPGLSTAARAGGDMAGALEAGTKAGSALGGRAGIAVVAIGGLGVALAGAAAAAAGMVRVAEGLNKELADLAGAGGVQVLSPEQLALIQSANRAMEGMGVVGKEVVVMLASELAPAVEAVSVWMLKLFLITRDQLRALAQGEGIFRTLANYLAKEFVQSLLGPIDLLVRMISLWGELAGAVGMDSVASALQGVQDRWEAFSASVGESAVESVIGGVTTAFGWLDEQTQDYDKTARDLIGTLQELADAEGKVKKEQEKKAPAWDPKKSLNQAQLDLLIRQLFSMGGESAPSTLQIFRDIAPAFLRAGGQNFGRSLPGAFGGLAQGDPTALLGALGPLGGALGGLAAIGTAGGAKGVAQQLSMFTDAFVAGLEALPEILSTVLPGFVTDLVGTLIPALIQASPQIFAALIAGLAKILGVTDEPEKMGGKQAAGGALGAVLGGVGGAFVGFAVGGPAGAVAGLVGGAAAGNKAGQNLTDGDSDGFARTSGQFTFPGQRAQLATAGGVHVSIAATVVDRDAIGRLADRLHIELGVNGRRAGLSLAGG